MLSALPNSALVLLLGVAVTIQLGAASSGQGTPVGSQVAKAAKHWLFTIAEEGWRPAAGEKVAIIGPLVVAIDKPYTARYMEAVFPR